MATMSLSIIIVNWNSANFVKACLTKIYEHAIHLPVEIIVIDNASHDDCEGMIVSRFPSVLFIKSDENLGFSRANNVAFRQSTGDLVLFLNPDTEVYDGAIERMTKVLIETPEAGVVGARLLNSDGTVQMSCIQKFPSIVGILMDSDCLRRWWPQLPLWGMQPLLSEGKVPSEVEAISGACQMVRRKAFERVSMYTTDYFMYAEDVDLCLKMNRLGLRNLYVPDALVKHHGGQSSNAVVVSGWSAILMRESWKRFFEQHRSRRYARMFQATVVLQAALRITLLSLAMLVPAVVGRGQQLVLVRKKWTSILRWALGLEEWVNNPTARSLYRP
jgi:N-acetylglucosaminyl-diphospho-decaprenol L-rhamnosyltransferase